MDPATLAMLAKLGQGFSGGLGSVISGLFSHSGRPYEKAGEEFGKYFGQAQNYQNPFYRWGRNALPDFSKWLNTQADPSAFINKLMGGYHESPWAHFATEQAQRGANNAASASGLIGSTPLAQENANYAKNISSQDMGSWLDRVLGINTQYGQGQQNLITTGQNAANSISSLLSKLGELQGERAYGEEAGRERDRSGIISGILKMFGQG